MQVEITNKTKQKIDNKTINRVAQQFAQDYKKEKYELSVVFVGDQRIRTINKKYRNIDKVTDILAFVENDSNSFFLGELILNYARIKKQARQYGHSAKKELIFILVHGLLHLVGYTDDDEAGLVEMKKIGASFIAKHNLYKNA